MAADERRIRRKGVDDAETVPGQAAPAPAPRRVVYNPEEVFPQWLMIKETVQNEFVTRMRTGEVEYEDYEDRQAFNKFLQDLFARTPSLELPLDLAQREQLFDFLYRVFYGLGGLEPFLNRADTEDVVLNRYDQLYVYVGGEVTVAPVSPFSSDKDVLDFLARIYATQGKELNRSNPVEDATLPGGFRISALIPPVVENPAFVIRKQNITSYSVEDYLKMDMFPRAFLEDMQSWVDNNQTLVLSGGTSSGKALSLDAKLVTPRGFIRMGDVKVDETLISSNGKPCRVTGVFPQGTINLYRVTFSDGSSVECCDEHLWQVQSRRGKHLKKHARVLPLAMIRKQMEKYTSDSYVFVPLAEPSQFESRPKPSTDSYRFGVTLGNSYSIFSDAESIPDEYKLSSINDRLSLLQGLCDSAAIAKPGRAEIQAVPLNTANDIVFIVQSLGGQAVQRYAGHRALHLRILLPSQFNLFRSPKKLAEYARHRVPLTRRIVAIEPAGSKPAQCITVDAPDQLYLTDDFIVTHNTTFLNFVSGLISVRDRVVVIEDTRELNLQGKNILYTKTLQRGARRSDSDETAIRIRDLVRYALRLRPDRIIVGECRQAEALDMLQAVNTGHDGSMTTLHANSAREAVQRLENMTSMAEEEIPANAIQEMISSGVDIIIQVQRLRGVRKRRVVAAVQVIHPLEIPPETVPGIEKIRDSIYFLPLWQWDMRREELVKVNELATPPDVLV